MTIDTFQDEGRKETLPAVVVEAVHNRKKELGFTHSDIVGRIEAMGVDTEKVREFTNELVQETPFFMLLGPKSPEISLAMEKAGISKEEITTTFIDSLDPKRAWQIFKSFLTEQLGPSTLDKFVSEFRTWSFTHPWERLTAETGIDPFFKTFDPEVKTVYDKKQVAPAVLKAACRSRTGHDYDYCAFTHKVVENIEVLADYPISEETKKRVYQLFDTRRVFSVFPTKIHRTSSWFS